LESKLNIFLIRIGFIKNLNQSNYIIKKGGIFVNNKQTLHLYKKLNIKDCIQVSYNLKFFFQKFFKKKKKFNYFLILKILKKQKHPFYLEINEKIQTSFLLYKPEPNLFTSNLNIVSKFNFFFYKFFFYFLKKKTF